MANVPTVGLFIPGGYLNACNSTNDTGAQDAYGNIFPTGTNAGKMIEVGDLLAASLSAPNSANQLFGGAYQWIQVDSGATAAYVAPGRAAFMKLEQFGAGVGTQPQLGYQGMVVTSQDQADSINLRTGVFINSITPGNWGFIFAGAGRVEVTYRSALTNGSPAVGDAVGAYTGGNGLFDDLSATAVNAVTFGYATTTPVANGTSAIYIRDIMYRIPGV